jgi:hypothetical protein
MRKFYKPIIVFLCTLIVGSVYIGIPKQLNLSYNALEYQLGNTQFQSPTKIKVDGWYYNRIFKKDSFAGTITVGDKVFSNVKVTESSVLMSYNKTIGEFRSFGEIIIGDYCREITLCLFEPKGGWSSGDGMMISAPAASRSQALDISNRLMRERLIESLE